MQLYFSFNLNYYNDFLNSVCIWNVGVHHRASLLTFPPKLKPRLCVYYQNDMYLTVFFRDLITVLHILFL